MRGGGAADGPGAHLGQADMAHIAGPHHLGDGAHRLLHRHGGVEAGGAVDVDMVHPQPRERIGQRGLHRRRAGVVADPLAGGVALGAELHADLHAVARNTAQRLADQHLIMAHAVEVAGIQQGDAGLSRRMDGGDAFRPVGGAIHAGHAHAAEAEGGNLGAGGAENTVLHRKPPGDCWGERRYAPVGLL
jgi:hypothetical protein